MDVYFQHPIECIPKLLDQYENKNIFYAEYIQLEKVNPIYKKNSFDNFDIYYTKNKFS